jgi:hypothetical protein
MRKIQDFRFGWFACDGLKSRLGDKRVKREDEAASGSAVGGLAGWLVAKLRSRPQPVSRLALVERIALAPRQSLALVEAEGRRILVATSAEGGPAFYALDDSGRAASRSPVQRSPRVSW